MVRGRGLLCALGLMLAACGGTAGPGTTRPPTTTEPGGDGAPFTLVVEPAMVSPVMAGQRCVVLVSIEGAGGPATVTAAVDGPATVQPETRQVDPGDVVEYTVIPDAGAAGGGVIRLDLSAERAGRRDSSTIPMEIVDWTDDLEPTASELRDRFVAYLEANRRELGITQATRWEPTITKPQILVVMHYLFFSPDWEMGIIWHVTVPEHAWSRMYLRRRDQLAPSIGLEIPSYLDPGSQPIPWEPPPEVDR